MMNFATAALAASLLAVPIDGERPPNVIVIMADDLGVAELGCTGSTRIRTPNIDALRDEGMLFTEAYSGSTVCAPSRCTLLTGLHTGHAQIRDNGETPNFTGPPEDPSTTTIGGWQEPPEPNGLWGGQRPIREGTETIARVLQRAGYATCGLGKWGLGGPGSVGLPGKQGFDHWFGYLCQRNAHNYYPTYLVRNEDRVTLEGNDRGFVGEQYAADLMADEALAFVRDHAEEPFFLYYATPVPHLALQVPEDSIAEYRGTWDDPPYEGGKGYLAHPEPRSAYAGMVTRFDRDVGRLIDLLDELGITDDTVVIFTSDNGSTFNLGGYDPEFFDGTGGRRGFKTNLYEGGIRVPFIVAWPGHIKKDSTSNVPVANWDIFPTVLGLTDTATDADLDGINLAPVLLGTGKAPKREALYWEYHSRGGIQAVRMGQWKGVRSKAHADANAPIELFNLEEDPNETTDVAVEHPEVVARIETIMRESRTDSPIAEWNFGPEARVAPPKLDASASNVERTWTGKGDGSKFADPKNWTGEGVIMLGSLRDKYIIDDGAAVVGGRSGCDTITCEGGELVVRKGRLTGKSKGFRNGVLRVEGGDIDRQFVLRSNIVVSGDGVLRLYGAGSPVNASKIDIQGDVSRVEFINENPEEVRKEHLRKFSIDGKKAVEGKNVVLEKHGPDGSIVRAVGGSDK